MAQHHDTTLHAAGVNEAHEALRIEPSLVYRVLAASGIGLALLAITYAVIAVLTI